MPLSCTIDAAKFAETSALQSAVEPKRAATSEAAEGLLHDLEERIERLDAVVRWHQAIGRDEGSTGQASVLEPTRDAIAFLPAATDGAPR